ncbi:MAG: STAS-like domain-containing protein [bacterium]
MHKIVINIFEKIGSTAAVSSEDGDLLFKLISKAFKNEAKVILDFNNIDLLTSTFLNAAIGQLYGFFDGSFLKEHLAIQNMEKDDLVLLKKVVERAKEYFKNKNLVEKAIKETLGE